MTNPDLPKTLVELTIDKLIAGYECSNTSLDEVRALSKDELTPLIEKRLDIVWPSPIDDKTEIVERVVDSL